MERILLVSTIYSFQQELSALRRGFNRIEPTNNGAKSELDDDELYDLKI